MRKATPKATKPPQISDPECELEGNMRVAKEEPHFRWAQGLCMVDKSTVIRLRIPETTGLAAPLKRTGLREQIIQLACTRVGNISNPPRTYIEEVALNPRGEIRTYGAHDSAWHITQAQCASAGLFSSFVLFLKPFHGRKSIR